MFLMPGYKCYSIRSSMNTTKCVVVLVFAVSLVMGATTPQHIPPENQHPLPITTPQHIPPENQNPLPTTTPQHIPPENQHPLPTTTEAGVMYYDLAQADTTEVILDGSNDIVKGVTASGKCQVQTLELHTNLTIDETVSEYCPLRNVTFIGSLICSQVIMWTTRLTTDVHVDFQEVTCTDVIIYITTDKHNTVQSKLTDLMKDPRFVEDNFFCPRECNTCVWYVLENDFYVNVDCDDSKITDATLPSLPGNTSSLTFLDNQIMSMKNLIKHLENQPKLKVLMLGGNQITIISALPAAMFKKLQFIDLSHNNIKELDPMVVETIISRRGLVVSMYKNPLRCGCHLYHINRLFRTYCEDASEYPCIKDYFHLRCYIESDNSTSTILQMNDLRNCEQEPLHINYWLILAIIFGLLNMLMFWLIFDILLILWDFRGTKHTKRPKLDYIVSWWTTFLKKNWATKQNRNQGEETAMINLRDTSSHIRGSRKRVVDSWNY